MNIESRNDDVLENGVNGTVGRETGHTVQLSQCKTAAQLADALLSNEQLLDGLFGD